MHYMEEAGRSHFGLLLSSDILFLLQEKAEVFLFSPILVTLADK